MKPFYIYNTLIRTVEEFKPLTPAVATYYSCGPTVYLPQHLGNMRSYLFADTLKRALRFNGYEVRHVMNVTDVGHLVSDADDGEDKMEKGSRRTGRTAWEIARIYTEAFLEDMERLNLEPPTTLCRATDHIPEQIAFIAEDISATYDLWRSRGVRFLHPPQPELWGGTTAVFCDVDGNSFDLLGSDEMSREIEAQRRASAERLESERRVAQELEIAKQVQARLFPQNFPALRTLDYAGACIQARQVGGDYYDFFALGQGRLGLFVGDISGKGIAAALLMANLQANLRSQFALAREEPQRFLQSVNQLFFENTVDSAYATVFFAEYDDAAQHLRYTNCGHLSALLLRRDGAAEWLRSTGTVLGLFKEWESPTVECQLFPGDTLALYTDGVTESFNGAEEEFGEQRLIEALARHRGQDAESMVTSVIREVQRFSPREQHDDITLIVAKCRG